MARWLRKNVQALRGGPGRACYDRRHATNSELHGIRSLATTRPISGESPYTNPGFHLEEGESYTPLHRMPQGSDIAGSVNRAPNEAASAHPVSRKGPGNRKALSMALIHETDRDSTSTQMCGVSGYPLPQYQASPASIRVWVWVGDLWKEKAWT